MSVDSITVFKPYGMTPRELVDLEVQKHKATKGAFSGRLDPMACGLVKIYFDDACKRANQTDKQGKTYRFILIIGIKTTSHDLLGFPIIDENRNKTRVTTTLIESSVCPGEIAQEQPVHSSFVVRNKSGVKNPLWWWALHNRLDEIEIPTFKRHLYKSEVTRIFEMDTREITDTAISRIELIDRRHTFNQESIKSAWRDFLRQHHGKKFQLVEMVASVSSGFYIRQLVSDIGSAIGVYTTTFEIERLSYNE